MQVHEASWVLSQVKAGHFTQPKPKDAKYVTWEDDGKQRLGLIVRDYETVGSIKVKEISWDGEAWVEGADFVGMKDTFDFVIDLPDIEDMKNCGKPEHDDDEDDDKGKRKKPKKKEETDGDHEDKDDEDEE
ncbi:MAG: hypothetical protein OEX12_11675 [Gammaproteobacteria bacterium]|nr:hypothetical protein [Gammaproteobacteria bacterium]